MLFFPLPLQWRPRAVSADLESTWFLGIKYV